MRQSCLAAAIGSVLLLLASPVIARETFDIPTSLPATYKDLYTTIKKDAKAKEDENIPAYLDKAQCGGWNMEQSVKGKIATVTAAPGHSGAWDGDISSGMAVRADAYSYPGEGVSGYSSICDMKKDKISKTYSYGIQFYGELTGEEIIFEETKDLPHPYFEDPACLWGAMGKMQGPQTPDKCKNSCDWMNTYTYEDCKTKAPDLFCYGPDNCIDVTVCLEWDNRYTCSDEWVNDKDVQRNCRVCQGEECRCGTGTPPNQNSCFMGTLVPKPYQSFYRQYGTSYTRDKVPDAKSDVASKNGNVGCYGLYDEFDPKTHATQSKDQRCVVNIELQDMKETQLGKGAYGETSNLADPAPAKRGSGTFVKEKDLWYMHLGQAFSLLSEQVFGGTYGGSIGKVLMNSDKLDKGEQKAIVQISKAKPVAEHSETRAFDETAQDRVLSKWWQEQQTRMQTYAHGPVLRLVLPTTWAIGGSTDPFLKDAEIKKEETEPIEERSESIEVQIKADEDTLGEAVAFIERSLTLQVVEEPIPVVIPFADPVELRSAAAAWCAWVASTKNAANCDDAPANVKKLMESLQKYADDMEEYRKLRGLLAEHVAQVFKLQNDVVKPLTDWMKGNIAKYKESVAARKRLTSDIVPILDKADEVLRKFNDDTNLPWCMNQRFTLPVYSLLDPWLPSRASDGEVSDKGLPAFPDPEEVPTDIVVDISRMSYIQTQLTIPVLKPVQVRLAIPRPPSTDDIVELPDIGKDIEKIRAAIRQGQASLPKVKTKGTPPAITIPEPLKPDAIAKMKTTSAEILAMFTAMDKTYDDFWKSMGPLTPKNKWTDADKLQDEKKKKLECDWGIFPCVHVEMDLLERFTRIGSRPLVMLKEDYDSKGAPRTDAKTCLPEDHVCLLMHPEQTKPVQGWEIRGPATDSSSGFLDTVRSAILNITFPTPLGSVEQKNIPPYDASVGQRAQGVVTVPASPILPEQPKP